MHRDKRPLEENEGGCVSTRPGCDDQFEFEFALDLMLDGLDALREREWSSAGRAALPQ